MRDLSVKVAGGGPRLLAAFCGALCLVFVAMPGPDLTVQALGPGHAVALAQVSHGGAGGLPRPGALKRLAWELRKRTSVDAGSKGASRRLDSPAIYSSPFLYWSGDRAFDALSAAEIEGFRRFVELGGFVLIDDASPERSGFDASVRRALLRAFPRRSLAPMDADHTVFRSYYLLSRPVGRVEGPGYLEALTIAGRAAVVYARQDLAGAWARDGMGNPAYHVIPGGAAQREQAIRLGINLVMYALCLDYKDDQVHAPFIMRRRGRLR